MTKRRREAEVIYGCKSSKEQILDKVPQELSELCIVPVSRSIDQPYRNPPPRFAKESRTTADMTPEYFRPLGEREIVRNSEFPKRDNVSEEIMVRDDRRSGLGR